MNETNPPAVATTEPQVQADQRVSTLVGDRLCIKCHYNLCGQPIVREGHYGMLIVRCAECGTVASLQEHPLLGRWAGRWAIVLVGLWLLVLLVTWLISNLIMYGITNSVAVHATDPYARHVAELQQVWIERTGADQQQMWWYGGRSSSYYAHLHQDWWDTQDPAALLAEVGGWVRVADWRAMWSLARVSPLAIAFGCVWALLLPHVRRRWLPVLSPALVALAMWFVFMGLSDPMGIGLGWSIGDTVFPQVGQKVQYLAVLALLVPLCIGLLLGRTLARLLVRAILPPRLRGSLAGLWLIDNLQPPVGAMVRHR